MVRGKVGGLRGDVEQFTKLTVTLRSVPVGSVTGRVARIGVGRFIMRRLFGVVGSRPMLLFVPGLLPMLMLLGMVTTMTMTM